MHAVVNRLRLTPDRPADLWSRAQDEVPARARQVPGFHSVDMIELSATEVVLVVVADSPATLDRIADEVGNAWMRENVFPYLAGPPERQIGEVVVTSDT